MSVNLVVPDSGVANVTGVGREDKFAICFTPAQPVLDAVIEMWRPLGWLDRRRRSRAPLFEPKQAAELLEIIPEGGRLARAGALFLEAEEQPAPVGWLDVAVGLMIDSELGALGVTDAYSCAIYDGAYNDPEIVQGFAPGFSCAVVAQAIRAARRRKGLPSSGEFLDLCVRYRAQFRRWNSDMGTLLSLRYEAEDAVELQTPRLALTYVDDEMDIPF
jgi:hypothetical protein